MSNFFRDSSLGFKPRSNIFSKLRVKEPPVQNFDTSTVEDGNSSMMNYMFSENDQSTQNIEETNTTDGAQFSNETLQNGSESGKRHINTSTPKSSKKINTVPTDDDDFEITEIRDLAGTTSDDIQTSSTTNEKRNIPISHHSDDQQRSGIEASSNDVLLEAFTNTQRICANLKLELQKEHAENNKLKSELKTTKRIVEKVDKYRSLLSSLQDKSTTLFKQKNLDIIDIQELKKSQLIFQSKINIYKEEVTKLKSDMTEFQKYKAVNDADLIKKERELDYVQRELDDCSGQLSEEKIKNSSLLEEITNIRKEILALLESKFSINEHLNVEQMKLMEETLKGFFKDELNLKQINENEATANESKVLMLNFEKMLTNNVKIFLDQSTSTIVSKQENYQNDTKKYLQEINDKSLTLETILKTDISNTKTEILNGVINIVEETKNEFSKSNDRAFEKFKNLDEKLDNYQTRLVETQSYEEKIHEYEKQITSLEQQKTEYITSLGIKNAEYEELNGTVDDQMIEISRFTSVKEVLEKHNEQLDEDLKKTKVECKKLNEVLVTEKSNFENKIASQNGINNAIMSENDTLKQRIQELEISKNNYERDHSSRMDKFQKLNEQIQKHNVELVQLKAHELELDEDNRKLKRMLKDNEMGQEEDNTELKLLRQEMICLESEKQDVMSDKLDLQDKLEKLEKNVRTMRKSINNLTNELTGYKENRPIAEKELKPSNQSKSEPKRNGIRNRSIAMTSKKEQPSSDFFSQELLQQNKVEKSQVDNNFINDEFDLPSSSNDDFELTNPSPIYIKPLKTNVKRGNTITKSSAVTRKKLLLIDDDNNINDDRKKRRKNCM